MTVWAGNLHLKRRTSLYYHWCLGDGNHGFFCIEDPDRFFPILDITNFYHVGLVVRKRIICNILCRILELDGLCINQHLNLILQGSSNFGSVTFHPE